MAAKSEEESASRSLADPGSTFASRAGKKPPKVTPGDNSTFASRAGKPAPKAEQLENSTFAERAKASAKRVAAAENKAVKAADTK